MNSFVVLCWSEFYNSIQKIIFFFFVVDEIHSPLCIKHDSVSVSQLKPVPAMKQKLKVFGHIQSVAYLKCQHCVRSMFDKFFKFATNLLKFRQSCLCFFVHKQTNKQPALKRVSDIICLTSKKKKKKKSSDVAEIWFHFL